MDALASRRSVSVRSAAACAASEFGNLLSSEQRSETRAAPAASGSSRQQQFHLACRGPRPPVPAPLPCLFGVPPPPPERAVSSIHPRTGRTVAVPDFGSSGPATLIWGLEPRDATLLRVTPQLAAAEQEQHSFRARALSACGKGFAGLGSKTEVPAGLRPVRTR